MTQITGGIKWNNWVTQITGGITWNNWVTQITGGITWNNWIFKFHQVLNRVQKIPWLIYIIEILGENDVITRKMTGKSTKWERIKASPYNYCPSPLHHTFLLGRARFTTQPLSAVRQVYTTRQNLHNSVLWTTVVRSELPGRSSMDGFFPTEPKNTKTDLNGLVKLRRE